MSARVLLLRGINLGPHRRIAMAALREALDAAGYGPVRTYLQSGNVVLSSDASAGQLETDVAGLIERSFSLTVPVITRSAPELAAVLARDPLGEVAEDPKRYQVTFCATEPDGETIERLAGLATAEERVVSCGREIYVWHPDGVARSKLWNTLAAPGFPILATSRNWSTVQALNEMAGGPAA